MVPIGAPAVGRVFQRHANQARQWELRYKGASGSPPALVRRLHLKAEAMMEREQEEERETWEGVKREREA